MTPDGSPAAGAHPTTALEEVADINPESLSSGTPPNFSFRYVDLGSAHRGQIDWASVREMRFGSAPSRARRVTKAGDVLFGTVRPTLQSHGAIPADGARGTIVASTGFSVIRARRGAADPRFLFQFVMSDELTRQARRLEVGSNYPAVNESDVRRFQVPDMSVLEQRATADVLDSVDDAIRLTDQIIGKLNKVKDGIRNDLMRTDLTADGSAAAGAWPTTPLACLTLRITDGTHQAVTIETAADVPFLYVSCIRDGEIIWENAGSITWRTYDQISKGREPRHGMVLYTAVGSYGHAALVDTQRVFAFQRHVACVYPDPRLVDPAYLAFWLDSPQARRHADRVALGNAQLTVTLGELAQYPIPVPPLEEQRAIAARLTKLDAQRQSERSLLAKLGLLRQGLTRDLLSGVVSAPVPPKESGT